MPPGSSSQGWSWRWGSQLKMQTTKPWRNGEMEEMDEIIIFRFHQFHSFHQLHQFHEVSCFELPWREFREYTWHEARQKACSALDNFNWSPEFLDILFCWDCCLLFFSKLDMWPRRTLQKPEMVRASESHAVRKLQLAMDILQVLQVERARSLRAKRNRTFFSTL